MTSIGERLRRQRLERGFDLGQVARETKISQKLLEAIEAEDFDKLPGGVFRKSFVRQYARALGLDEDEIAADLEQIVPPEDPLALLHQGGLESEIPALPTASKELNRRWLVTSFGSFATVLVVMLACAAVYSWWQKSRQEVTRENVKSHEAAPPPAATQPAIPPPPATESSAAPPVTPAAAQVAPQSPEPAVALPPGKFRVGMTAIEPVWVRVTVDGKPAFVGTLESGASKTFDAESAVRVRAGNAGGLSVELNGKPIGEIGPRGQVRTVELTPSGSTIVVPPPPKPAEEPEPKSPETTPPPAQPAPPAPDSTVQRLQG
jgi:cytoskeleton protein RodZ